MGEPFSRRVRIIMAGMAAGVSLAALSACMATSPQPTYSLCNEAGCGDNVTINVE